MANNIEDRRNGSMLDRANSVVDKYEALAQNGPGMAYDNMTRGTPLDRYTNNPASQDLGYNDMNIALKDDANASWQNSTQTHDAQEQNSGSDPEMNDMPYQDAQKGINDAGLPFVSSGDRLDPDVWGDEPYRSQQNSDEAGFQAFADGGEVEDDYSVDPTAFAQKQGLPQEQAQPQDDQGDIISRVLDYGRRKYGLLQGAGQRVRKEIDALPPPLPPGFAEGGPVDDEETPPQGEPQPDVPTPQPRPLSADYTPEAQTAPYQGALDAIKAPFAALGEAAGAGGAAEAGMPPQYMGYLTGDVAHPDAVKEAESAVKEQNPSLSPSDAKVAAIEAAFAKDPESGWQLSQNYRQKHEHSRFAGVALADQGDLKQAADLANHAFETLPNGFDYHFAPKGNDAVSVTVSQQGHALGTKIYPAQEFREFLASKDAQYDHAIDNPTAVLQGGQDASKAGTAGKPDYISGWASKDAGDLKERLSHVNVPELEKEQMIAKTLGEGGQKYPSEIQKEQMGNDTKMDVATATADARYKQQQMVETYKTNRAAMSDATKDKASQLRASTSLMVAAQNASSREEAEKYRTLGRMLSPSSGIPVNIDKAAQMAAAMGVDLKQALGGLGQAPMGQLPQVQAPTSVQSQPQQAQRPQLQPGQVYKGHTYLGGDPANPKSWR